MPANLVPPRPEELLPVAGVSLGVAAAGIRKPGRKDLLVIALRDGARTAGVFTRNAFCAAPVVIAREHLSQTGPVLPIRALVVNTGNANAGTGEEGIARARATCSGLARLLACDARQILPFSTGVIMEPLPLESIIGGLPAAIADLRPDNWFTASQAIMTTDLVPKAASRRITFDDGTVATLTGIAKGSGMIRPDMATMLAYVATDATVEQPLLQEILHHATRASFNRIIVDGDTSTNDAFMLIATGAGTGRPILDDADPRFLALRAGVTELAEQLAQMIVRDGEGATKFITIRVEGGSTEDECDRVAHAIARSPLVKTAFFASDPNLGRILAAVGYAGVEGLNVNGVRLYLDDVLVAESGGRAAGYREEDGQRVMRQTDITVRVVLGRGTAGTTTWTCDLSHDYVDINASYRS